MREIKFRAWDKKKKKFIDVNRVIGDWENTEYVGSASIIQQENITGTTLSLLSNDDLVWIQSTGLKDKNGKEVYEGDIFGKKSFIKGNWGNGDEIRDTYFIFEVVFEGGGFCYQVRDYTHSFLGANETEIEDEILKDYRNKHIGTYMAFDDYNDNPGYLGSEIIGNAYENPNLLSSLSER